VRLIPEPDASAHALGSASRWSRLALIGVLIAGAAALFLFVGGWLPPHRLTPARMVDALQTNSGLHPGSRRNHAKGACVSGEFQASGAASPYTVAGLFAAGTQIPVIGRFAIPGGNPDASDSSTPIRSVALRFTVPNRPQGRTGMNAMPVFPVATPQAFYDPTVAGRTDASTQKPDPARMQAFFATHPETAPFLAWMKTASPAAGYATESDLSLNAFAFVDSNGTAHPVRWRMAPEANDVAPAGPQGRRSR
jgi:catalase